MEDARMYMHYVLKGTGTIKFFRNMRTEPGKGTVKPGKVFQWPQQRDEALRYAQSFSKVNRDGSTSDLFLRVSVHDEGGNPVDLSVIHADIDGPIDPDVAVDEVGALVVLSGTRGHAHVYARLDEPAADIEEYKWLCRELGEMVALDPSSVDNKIHPNDLLRMPGTMNWKHWDGSAEGGQPVTLYPRSRQNIGSVVNKAEWLKRRTGTAKEARKKEAVTKSRTAAFRKYKAALTKLGEGSYGEERARARLEAVYMLLQHDDPERACGVAAAKIGVSLNASDRSAISFWLSCELAERGLDRDEIVAVMSKSPRNKFVGRADELTCLYREADRAISKVQAGGDIGEEWEKAISAHLIITDIAEIKEEDPFTWLADSRIARGATNLLIGEEGIGKSMFWVWLSRQLMEGNTVPEFGLTGKIEPNNGEYLRIALIITEDHPAYVIKPRLAANGITSGVHLIEVENDSFRDYPSFPNPAYEADLIRERFDLIVVDGWLDTVEKGLKVEKPQDAARALAPWRNISQLGNTATLLVTHTNRADTKVSRDKYGVTSELRKKTRSALFAMRDEKTKNLIIGTEKSNLARLTPAVEFTMGSVELPGYPDTWPSLSLVGQSDMDIQDHIADKESPIETWLKKEVSSGPRYVTEIMEGAEALGYTKVQVRRAKERLGITHRKEKKHQGRTYWEMSMDG